MNSLPDKLKIGVPRDPSLAFWTETQINQQDSVSIFFSQLPRPVRSRIDDRASTTATLSLYQQRETLKYYESMDMISLPGLLTAYERPLWPIFFYSQENLKDSEVHTQLGGFSPRRSKLITLSCL